MRKLQAMPFGLCFRAFLKGAAFEQVVALAFVEVARVERGIHDRVCFLTQAPFELK